MHIPRNRSWGQRKNNPMGISGEGLHAGVGIHLNSQLNPPLSLLSTMSDSNNKDEQYATLQAQL
jgi:hypothetical protein